MQKNIPDWQNYGKPNFFQFVAVRILEHEASFPLNNKKRPRWMNRRVMEARAMLKALRAV